MFSGRLHPAELAGKLAREADFARFDHAAGPATANLFVISIHPRDLTVEPPELEMMLSTELTDYVVEEGLRTAGPIGSEGRDHYRRQPWQGSLSRRSRARPRTNMGSPHPQRSDLRDCSEPVPDRTRGRGRHPTTP